MKIRPLVVLAIVALLLASGCATVTFKRGAGPGSMRSDEDACRATSTDEMAYAACLRERGWFVAGKPAGAETPAAEPDTAAPADSAMTAEPAPAAVPAITQPSTPPADPTRSAPAVTGPAMPPTKAVPAAVDKAPPAVAPKAVDPLTRVDVGSWWKLGGTAADLDRAIAACVATLGDAHRPNPGATLVTIGLRDCLRTAKWFPVGRALPQ